MENACPRTRRTVDIGAASWSYDDDVSDISHTYSGVDQSHQMGISWGSTHRCSLVECIKVWITGYREDHLQLSTCQRAKVDKNCIHTSRHMDSNKSPCNRNHLLRSEEHTSELQSQFHLVIP